MKTKNLKSTVCMLLISLIFSSSCKKHNEVRPSSSSIPIILQEIYHDDDQLFIDTATYFYNNQGKLTKLEHSSDTSYLTFEYTKKTVILKWFDNSDNLFYESIYNLNSKGLVESFTDLRSNHKCHPIIRRSEKQINKSTNSVSSYTYDSKNYLIQSVYVSDYNWIDSSFYQVVNGNTISCFSIQTSSMSTSTNNSNNVFLTDKINTIGYKNIGVTFFGADDINLLSQSTHYYDNSPPSIYNYTYEFDSFNRVTKKIFESGSYITYRYK